MRQDLEARLAVLEERIGVEFRNRMLLLEAVTHRSYLNECPAHPVGHNERLEFLGDAVLEMIVTEFLFRRFPEKPEGVLTNWRAAFVNGDQCAAIGERWRLKEILLMSKGQGQDASINAKILKTMLKNAFEAIIGAAYLDQGMPACTFIADSTLFHRASSIIQSSGDAKSAFQEMAQERWRITPEYAILAESGSDHDPTFRAGAMLEKTCVAEGEGKSKREAQVAAAKAAVETISTWESLFSKREQPRSDKGRSGKAQRS